MKVERHHREAAYLALYPEAHESHVRNFGADKLRGLDDNAALRRVAEAIAAAEHRGASTRALELWAMDVLTEWRRGEATRRDWTMHSSGDLEHLGASLCWVYERRRDGSFHGQNFGGSDDVAALIAAARALKQAHPELPDEPKEAK